MQATIVIIGDEILIGQVTDTNTGSIARALAPLGIGIHSVITVGDNGTDITRAIETALTEADLVITTGGLGPTKDDITKHVLAGLTGGQMVFDPASYANVERVLGARGLHVNELSRLQAMVPDSCTPLPNHCGTAPLMWFDINGKRLIALPGVPFETEAALRLEIVPRLQALLPAATAVERRVLLLEGISESAVAEQIDRWEDALPDGFHLAYLPNQGYLRLRLDGHGDQPDALAATADRLHAGLRQMLGRHVWLDHDLTPAEALLEQLLVDGLHVSTAESCTGGGIAAALTAIPGSSAAVAGGVVAYSNEAKQHMLGVGADTLATYGAVSEPTVAEMARGSQKAFGSDLAIATSGIAGPGGATPGKPVGTVCVGVAFGPHTFTTTLHLPGDRSRVTRRAINTALITALRLVRGEL